MGAGGLGMTLEALEVIEREGFSGPEVPNQGVCRCGAHRQHVLFAYIWRHPGASLVEVADALHLSHPNARQLKSRLTRRPDLARRCPECFAPTFYRLVCQSCGFEDGARGTVPLEVRFEFQSPVHRIQPLNGLGSATAYKGGQDSEGNRAPMKLQYGGENIRHLVEHADDAFLEAAKSDLWEGLKAAMLGDGVVEEANRLLYREVVEFRSRYPGLVRAKGARAQLVGNVLALLRLRYRNASWNGNGVLEGGNDNGDGDGDGNGNGQGRRGTVGTVPGNGGNGGGNDGNS
jgi:hypothetical protein